MTEAEVAMLITILEGAYHKEFSEDSVKAYTIMLEDIPFELARKAVRDIIKSHKWLPTIAEIREAALQIVNPIPPVDLAYEEARRIARNYTPYDIVEPQFSHPLIKKTVDVIGLRTMAFSEEPTIIAAQFKNTYKRLAEAETAKRKEQPILPGQRRDSLLIEVRDRLLGSWEANDEEQGGVA